MKILLSYNELKETLKNRFDLPLDFQFESPKTVVLVYVPLNVRLQLTVEDLRDNIITLAYKGMSLKDNMALTIAMPVISSKIPSNIIDILPKINKAYVNLKGIPNADSVLDKLEPEAVEFTPEGMEIKVCVKI